MIIAIMALFPIETEIVEILSQLLDFRIGPTLLARIETKIASSENFSEIFANFAQDATQATFSVEFDPKSS